MKPEKQGTEPSIPSLRGDVPRRRVALGLEIHPFLDSTSLLLLLVLTLALGMMAQPANAQEPARSIAHAIAKFRTEILLESAYLFYMAAELLILFLVTKARGYFQSTPLEGRLSLTRSDKHMLLAGTIVVVAIGAALFGRHIFITPMPDVLQNIAAIETRRVPQFLRDAYALRAHIHLGVFFFFLVTWVVLEIAIVAQGVRAYRQMRKAVS